MAFQRNKQSGGGFKRDKQGDRSYLQQAGDFVSGTYHNFTDPEQWKHALTESPEAKSVMNPEQSIPDLLRTSGDFVSGGLTDRLRAGLYDTTHEQEKAQTAAADTRLGSINEAADLGLLFAPGVKNVTAPNLALRAMPVGANIATKAGLYGAEGAGLSGASAVGHGDPVLPAMGVGGAFGAGGSIAADALGSVANIFSGKNKPQFKTDEELFAKEQITPKNTRQGKDLKRRAELAEQFRMAETKGMQGFKELSDTLESKGRAPGVPREFYEGVSKAGNQPNKAAIKAAGWGDVFRGGGGWGALPVAMGTAGIAPTIGAGLKMKSALMDEVDPKTVLQIKSLLLRGSGGGKNPAMTPEMKNELRHYLAKIGGSIGRQQ